MKRRDLEKHLTKHGCELERHGSRHDIWYNPKTGGDAAVPRHPKIEKKGTIRAICKGLGVPVPRQA